MVKKDKTQQMNVSSSDEDMSSQEDSNSYDDQSDLSNNQNNQHLKEADTKHLLNYVSDDSSDDDFDKQQNNLAQQYSDIDSDNELDLQKQKQEIVMNDTWGNKKQTYYHREDSSISESEEEEDLQAETARLAKIRSTKLARQAAIQMQDSDQEITPQQNQDAQMDDHDNYSDSSENSDEAKKLGDRLFADSECSDDNQQNQNQNKPLNLRKLANKMDSNLLREVIQKDSPELQQLLIEFQDATETMATLKPLIETVDKKLNPQVVSFAELKLNLCQSFCTFITFYLLLKVENKPVENHPVVQKLANIKTLFDQLKPLDNKINDILKQQKESQQIKDDISMQESSEEEQIKIKNVDLESSKKRQIKHKIKQTANFNELNLNNNNQIEGDQLYQEHKQKLNQKKQARQLVDQQIKQKVQSEIRQLDSAIQRNVTYDIYKAKGITRKRKKEDKNPRVKKRMKYEKLLKKRNALVQEYKQGDAAQQHALITNGYRAGAIKATKLH